MDNGIYITLSRQLGLFREMTNKANNLGNANTDGFQAEQLLYRPFSLSDGNRNAMAFTQDWTTYHDTRPGSIKVTGNPFDVAIKGPGYFVIETPNGERYTRAGNFQLDPEGTLVTTDGYPVLDNGRQRIVFEENDVNVMIGEAGNISVNGEDRGQLGVVEFENPQLMIPAGRNLYRAEVQPIEAVESTVQHGALEGSNVEPVTELVDMMQVSRAVGSTAKFIDSMYDLQRRASSVITKTGS